MLKQVKIRLQGVILPLAIILIWQLVSNYGMVNSYILPSPHHIYFRCIQLIENGSLQQNILASLIRVVIGFLTALLLSIPLGIILGLNQRVKLLLNPILSFFQQIPGIALIPIFILWLGIDETSKIAIIVYSAIFPILLNTINGIETTDKNLIEVAIINGISKVGLAYRVYLPSMLPSLFVGMRLGLSYCWRSLVAVELLGASKGLGYLIQQGRELAQPETMFLGVFIIGLIGMSFDNVSKGFEKKIIRFKSNDYKED
ncbi:ABC-type nitrate/sulfonate/bicarbonate transport system, permease component [Desulfosporosinus orientis DSM 765]|uniref:ABC-type nitrate/sulfonate/bicarbonate transport system, permease component n=1 Tax=Desulfosporosinus orientis (strain ATCC 19365 / DSM 765 / NCIMB 8382 / VKM B-1628 / Singapore I) TaxID=768706 RepID=G7WJ36_DESOD|nr:ABC transporter permease [Desulfosporosinus orientis]AET70348.1 ABC-type nitrate/sulfonate/bicarbonate transport system, permease component [Desulfosporosinus orientis DSM 765]